MRVIAGAAKGARLVTPRGEGTRPATDRIRESMFGILGPEIEGHAVLDLFAGAGTLGIEALSRGAARAVFVERRREAVAALRANLRSARMDERADVRTGEVLAYLDAGSAGGPFDLAFCDPPFADDALGTRVLAHPGLIAALAPGALVVARGLRKRPPLPPPAARVVREKVVGGELLRFLRYSDAPAGG